MMLRAISPRFISGLPDQSSSLSALAYTCVGAPESGWEVG